MKKIIVNDQLREFIDPDCFLIQRFDDNLRSGNTDACGLRQTGRTTRMIVKALQKVVENPETRITIVAHNIQMVSCIVKLINHYKYQLDVIIPNDSITVVTKSSMLRVGEILLDNGVTDFYDEMT